MDEAVAPSHGERSVMNQDAPTVSVVIVNHNLKGMLIRCLESVLRTRYPSFEILVVDNASSDGSVESIARKFRDATNLKVLANFNNLGYARGNNLGIAASSGKYVAILNNDTIVDADWLKEAVSAFESNTGTGVAQCRLLTFDGSRIDSCGDIVDTFGLAFRRGNGEPSAGRYQSVEEVFSARGAALVVLKEIFESVGGLDSSLFLSYEDIDLSWRVRLAGYKVLYVPKSIVYHVGGASMPSEDSSTKVYYDTRNYLTVFLKNSSFSSVTVFNAQTIVIASAIVDLIFRRKPLLFLARGIAVLSVLRSLGTIWTSRASVKRVTLQGSSQEVKDVMLKSGYSRLLILFLFKIRYGERAANMLLTYWYDEQMRSGFTPTQFNLEGSSQKRDSGPSSSR